MAGDDLIDLAEQAAPIVVTGVAQANASVQLTWGNLTQNGVADASGDWIATFAALPANNDTEIVVIAVDVAGNASAPVSHLVTIENEPDPVTPPPTIAVVAGDDIVNAQEATETLIVSGTSVAGSTVNVTLGTVTESATMAASGNWTASFAPGSLPPDDGPLEISAVASLNEIDSEVGTREVTRDTEAPIALVSIADLIDDSSGQAVSLSDGDTTADVTPTLLLGLSDTLDPTDTIVLTLNGDTLVTLDIGDSLSVPLGPLDAGDYTMTAQVYDQALNGGLVSDPFTITISSVIELNSTV